MYAHQVIEDFKKYSLMSNSSNLHWLIHDISQSQHFFLGDIGESAWVYMTQKNSGKTISEVCDLPIKLPFKYCWFDYNREKLNPGTRRPKAGILVQENNDEYIFFIPFQYSKDAGRWIPIYYGPLAINKNTGKYCYGINIFTHINFNEEEREDAEQDAFSKISVVLQALMVLSCRNIETIDNPPPEKLNKKRQKKGKQPLFTYKTLVVKPTGKQQKSVPKHLWENRVHLCRGHFKTYTEDAPLFGKYTGRYWWQPSVRGNKEQGVVMKDYRVEVNA